MPKWSDAQTLLDALREADEVQGEALDILATEQAGTAICGPADAATALDLGLAAAGIDRDDPCPGNVLIRNVLDFLRSR